MVVAPDMVGNTCMSHSVSLVICTKFLSRDRLNKLWGVVDVRDCTLATAALGESPYSLIDGKRTAIRGGSSGGYTTLAALCVYPEAFAAGTSLYGISDLKKLEDFTHKFESKYMFKLLGGSSEEVPEVYRERSPLYNADKIKSPLLVRAAYHGQIQPKS